MFYNCWGVIPTMFSLRNCICVAIPLLFASCNYAFDVEKDLIFRLYTPANPVDYQKLKTTGLPPISTTSFDARLATRIFIHGFKSKEKTIGRYKDAFLNIGNYNFIGVDWISGASTYNYLSSKGHVPSVNWNHKIKTYSSLIKFCLFFIDFGEIGQLTGYTRGRTWFKFAGCHNYWS